MLAEQHRTFPGNDFQAKVPPENRPAGGRVARLAVRVVHDQLSAPTGASSRGAWSGVCGE